MRASLRICYNCNTSLELLQLRNKVKSKKISRNMKKKKRNRQELRLRVKVNETKLRENSDVIDTYVDLIYSNFYKQTQLLRVQRCLVEQLSLHQIIMESKKCNKIWSIQDHLPLAPYDRGHLFLGALGALGKRYLQVNRIGAVVTVLEDHYYRQERIAELMAEKQLQHMWVDIKDKAESSLYKYLQPTHQFIKSQLEHTNVLVHCYMGRSRSATIVIGFLIRERRMSFLAAQKLVKQKRSIIHPNRGFVNDLRQLQHELGIISAQGEEQLEKVETKEKKEEKQQVASEPEEKKIEHQLKKLQIKE